MNIFILCTGRCGSTTFIEACRSIENYTAAHESRVRLLGAQRVAYPDRHIEADNRLSWFLGRLDRRYGDRAFYVHLHRRREETARSFTRRWGSGIIEAYHRGILMNRRPGLRRRILNPESPDVLSTARDYCDTVEENIQLFLKDKTNWMNFALEDWETCFPEFWERIGARGDLQTAMGQWKTRFNAS